MTWICSASKHGVGSGSGAHCPIVSGDQAGRSRSLKSSTRTTGLANHGVVVDPNATAVFNAHAWNEGT